MRQKVLHTNYSICLFVQIYRVRDIFRVAARLQWSDRLRVHTHVRGIERRSIQDTLGFEHIHSRDVHRDVHDKHDNMMG